MPPAVIPSLNCIKGQKKQVSKAVVHEFHIPRKNNYNLICPACGVHLDRSQIKIHFYELGQDWGECPGCYKKVKFELFNQRGQVSELTKRYALELMRPKKS